MAEKSFVSIYFSPTKLQVVKLNASKKKVEKFASVELPPGLVMGYGVGNIKALSEIIKKTFASLHLGEKSVGLVVPEFSSFIKILKLPKLGQGDLDEAVRWQAQDFLPSSAGDMVMDWKIVRETPSEYQILAIAIRKEVLAGFVDAASLVGLLPLIVITPSLALARLVAGAWGGKLIIYLNSQEAILVVADGQKILGSTVINLGEGADPVLTASVIVRHYKDANVEKILVGGDVTTELLGKLQKSLGKSAEMIKVNMPGIETNQVQKYLIPYLLQLTPTAGPEEETTINLLPPKWVRKYLNQKLKLQIVSLLVISSFFIWGSLAATGVTYYYLANQDRALSQDPAVSAAGPPKELTTKVSDINKVVSKVATIVGASKYPQDVLNAIFAARPAGVSLGSYKIDMENGKITLKGIAQDRKSLVDFKDGLEKNKDFSLVQIPASSFEAETNLEFNTSFSYLPAVPKKGTTPLKK